MIHVQFRDQQIERVVLPQIEQLLSQFLNETEKPKLLIDFENVEYLTTTGLGMLVSVHKWVRERDGQLRLTRLNKMIRQTHFGSASSIRS